MVNTVVYEQRFVGLMGRDILPQKKMWHRHRAVVAAFGEGHYDALSSGSH